MATFGDFKHKLDPRYDFKASINPSASLGLEIEASGSLRQAQKAKKNDR